MATGQTTVLTRIAAVLLVLVVVLSSLALLIGMWSSKTVFSAEWYRPIIEKESFLTGVRTAVIDDLTVQAKQFSSPLPFLTQSMTSVITQTVTNERIQAFLNTYLDQFVKYMNYSASTPVPKNVTDLFSVPFLAAARELVGKFGLTLTAAQEQQIQQLAAGAAQVAQKHLEILSQDNFEKLAVFVRYHRLLYTISQQMTLAAVVLAVAAMLLLLLFLRHPIRFLIHVTVGIWLASLVITVPLVIVDLLGLAESVAISPLYIKVAVDELLTRAVASLKQPSLTILAVTSVALLILIIVQSILNRRVEEKY